MIKAVHILNISFGFFIYSFLVFFSNLKNEKAEKIRVALAKMRAASVTRLYVKAFSPDGSSKALMVEESMSCGRVLALLADKNHVPLSHKWALVEHIPHLHMGMEHYFLKFCAFLSNW